MNRQNVTKLFLFLVAILPAVQAESLLFPIKLDNPRDTMRSYMDAMKDYKQGMETRNKPLKKRLKDATRCLNLEDTPFVLREEKGEEIAILLKEVIDRIIVIDFEKIPEDTGGIGNPLLRWRLKGTEITISRVESGDHAGEYLFSKETVYRAKEFYNIVKHIPYLPGSGGGAYHKDPWLEKVLPDWARKKWLFFPNWQWIGLFFAILLGLVLKTLVQYIVHLLKIVTKKTNSKLDDRLLYAIDRPIGLIVASLFWFFSIIVLQYEGMALVILTATIQVILSISIIWLIYRLVDIFAVYVESFTSSTESTLDDQLVPLVQKALKIFVIVFGTLVMFQNLGVNVLSVLAGLGLGGLAFALAARDMCANLFGSIMILLDRPFNIGDWVVANNTEGTVEEIGFRSTRIRTFYNSLVTVPNSLLANSNIDNMGKREFRRIKAYIGVTYDTPPSSMESFLEGIKNIIKANPYTRKDYYHVVFNEYGNSCLQIMLYCFLKVPDWAAELVERQNIFLEIFRLADKLGIEFAFPTQSLHVHSFPGKDSIEKKEQTDLEVLKSTAKNFGPEGEFSKPAGLGLFTPPYRD